MVKQKKNVHQMIYICVHLYKRRTLAAGKNWLCHKLNGIKTENGSREARPQHRYNFTFVFLYFFICPFVPFSYAEQTNSCVCVCFFFSLGFNFAFYYFSRQKILWRFSYSRKLWKLRHKKYVFYLCVAQFKYSNFLK